MDLKSGFLKRQSENAEKDIHLWPWWMIRESGLAQYYPELEPEQTFEELWYEIWT